MLGYRLTAITPRGVVVSVSHSRPLPVGRRNSYRQGFACTLSRRRNPRVCYASRGTHSPATSSSALQYQNVPSFTSSDFEAKESKFFQDLTFYRASGAACTTNTFGSLQSTRNSVATPAPNTRSFETDCHRGAPVRHDPSTLPLDSCHGPSRPFALSAAWPRQENVDCGRRLQSGGVHRRPFSTDPADLPWPEFVEKGLQVSLEGREVEIPWVWLRDHCRCPACYNKDTAQKNVDSYSLDGLALHQSRVEGDTLTLTWHDGHVTKFSRRWLDDNFSPAGRPVERFLWDGQLMTQHPLPTSSFADHMGCDEGLRNTLKNIIKYGFCVVTGAPPTKEGTEEVARRVSFIQETVYGTVSVMVSGLMDHSDTAYTSRALGAHTDTTYFTHSAGIQVFHCLGHDGTGGSTLLVDGFRAATRLREVRPTYFRRLASTPVPHEYIEGARHHLLSTAPVLTTEPSTEHLVQIRFNPYDRAALSTVAPDDIVPFYNSYRALADLLRSPDSELWLKLTPGRVLLVDNWRVLHGRSAFTGTRTLCGCYLPRDDWTSRARTLGVL